MPDIFKITGKEYYTVQEASDISGISVDALYKLVQRGKIDHYRIDGLGLRFTKQQLIRHFDEGERSAQRYDELGDDLPF